jgi:Protein of unknown function (DUF4038)/Domain of unknown function (DUF5060)
MKHLSTPRSALLRQRLATLLLLMVGVAGAQAQSNSAQNRLFERTFESRKTYADPFNDVDVDVVFAKDGESWRVPTFWRGGSQWTVRFAPPTPGNYTYHLESTDANNPDLNGHTGLAKIAAYAGTNPLLLHGMLRLSTNRRYFEHADGTPFYWLGDTWWTGLSDRLSWDGFQRLTADRKAKGFSVVQIVAGMIPSNEELAPVDPGFSNEGGPVWDAEFRRINPKYFDYADRRIQQLADAGIAPAIVGGWFQALKLMGVAKMKKHWRYIIARYGAYPVFWIVGGEVYDPPAQGKPWFPDFFGQGIPGGWTDVVRYVRATDPYHHPVTVHEAPPYDPPLQDASLTDFDMFQPSHMGWSSIPIALEELDVHRARRTVAKPEVIGEIGYEALGGTHLADFQRVAFWLSMLNGAAGYSYGANGLWEAYTTDKPFHRRKWSLMTWEEGMNLPGSYQIGLGAKLLQRYPWWQFEPHPEWITPRGTTLLEPQTDTTQFDWGVDDMEAIFSADDFAQPVEATFPTGEWKAHNGNFRLPYAAGIPGKIRFIYMPCFGMNCSTPATVLGLEPDVRYHSYYWEPSLGIKVDLGAVERPSPGKVIRADNLENGGVANWTNSRLITGLDGEGDSLALANQVNEADIVAAVDGHNAADAGLVLRFHDADDCVAAIYSSREKIIYLLDLNKVKLGPRLRVTAVTSIGSDFRLSAEVRGGWGTVSITDGTHTYSSGIVRITNTKAGGAGFIHKNDVALQLHNFELRESPTLITNTYLERKLYDAQGNYRGEMTGDGLGQGPNGDTQGGWSDFGKEKIILLDSYRPERLPTAGDWVLVLESTVSKSVN